MARPAQSRGQQPARQGVQVFDQAGVVTSEAYDFKGNLLRSQARNCCPEYKHDAGLAAEPAAD